MTMLLHMMLLSTILLGSDTCKVISNYEIVHADSVIVARNTHTSIIDTLFYDESEPANDSTDKEDACGYGSYFFCNYKILFLIGPYFSYSYGWDGLCGAHVTSGCYYRTIDLATKNEVSLDSLFPPNEIFDQLLKDTIIIRSMKNTNPSNLYELILSLDGDCDISFKDILTSYAIDSVNLESIKITFGLKHGCESHHGHFTTITIDLPMSFKLRSYVSQ
jgi:hypothetical protein